MKRKENGLALAGRWRWPPWWGLEAWAWEAVGLCCLQMNLCVWARGFVVAAYACGQE